MSLIEQLRRILAEGNVLPADPNASISGTDLLELVRPKLTDKYSDNSLRQTFSVLSADPTSPIARAERGYGYYRRPIQQQASLILDAQGDAGAKEIIDADFGRDGQLEEKFRAFYLRYVRLENSFPVRIDHLTAQRRQAGVNKWKFPDAVVLTWDVGDTSDTGFSLDRSALEVKRGLGEQPFRLSSIELKVELSLGSFREYFFQCVSNSMWAHSSHLTVACPVSDALLANELRRLGVSYGVGISVFDFSRKALEELPTAREIHFLSDRDFEQLATKQSETTMSSGAQRPQLDWEHIKDLKAQSSEFSEVFDWIARCLRDSRAYSMENFRDLRQIESAAG
jgi:hypothetical protein